MAYTEDHIIRPDYGLYDPNFEGHLLLYRVLTLICFITFIIYNYYVILTLIDILKSDFLSALVNLIVLFIEFLLANYSIFLMWAYTRSFLPVDQPLKPLIQPNETDESKLPFVSILLPLYKESFNVVKQTLDAAQDLNYPKSRYEIAIADDSATDEQLKNYCKSHNIKYITRENRTGFKAGAVNNALPHIIGDYILFIDADHILERNVIRNCLIGWREGSIAVQTRIDFVNLRTFLTTVSAYLQIQFFSLFQRARRNSGSAIFAGGAALFDKHKVDELGGFDPLTIADDTDNSIIFRSKGYRIEYIDVVGAWALVPWDPLHLMRQIWRWLTGITRSFRARFLTIPRGKSPFYAKVDHFAISFFPTLSVIGWGVSFIMLLMVLLKINLITSNIVITIPLIGFTVFLVSLYSIISGVLAFIQDDKRIVYRKKPFFYKIVSIFAFYFLVLAVQPLLIGAVFKGLTGRKVEFNRTPKEKNVTDKGLGRVKRLYLIYTTIIFIIGIIFLIYALQIPLQDPRSVTLILNSYASVIPLIIAILWYWKLESYLDKVAHISALDILKEYT